MGCVAFLCLNCCSHLLLLQFSRNNMLFVRWTSVWTEATLMKADLWSSTQISSALKWNCSGTGPDREKANGAVAKKIQQRERDEAALSSKYWNPSLRYGSTETALRTMWVSPSDLLGYCVSELHGDGWGDSMTLIGRLAQTAAVILTGASSSITHQGAKIQNTKYVAGQRVLTRLKLTLFYWMNLNSQLSILSIQIKWNKNIMNEN